PETPPLLVLDTEIIARFFVSAPPFRGEALGAFGSGDAVEYATPAEGSGRAFGNLRRYRPDRLGRGEKPDRAFGEMRGSIPAPVPSPQGGGDRGGGDFMCGGPSGKGYGRRRAFGEMAFDGEGSQHGMIAKACPDAVGEQNQPFL